MKLAIVTTSYPSAPGDAAGHFVESEARALAREGHQVTVIAPGKGESVSDEAELAIVRVGGGDAFGWPGALARLRERPLRALSALRFAIGARRALVAHGPFERIVAHWILPCAWPIAIGLGPMEIVAHGSDVRLLLKAPRFASRALLRALVSSGASFRFVSRDLGDQLANRTGIDFGDARIQAPAFELELPPTRAQARALLGVDENARLLLVIGRLIGEKRIDVALRAASLVPGAEIAIVGDGPRARELRRLFPHARFLGHVARDRALCWIAAADLVVSASKNEGAPTSIREARALGTPVVSVRAGDLAAWAKSDPELYVLG